MTPEKYRKLKPLVDQALDTPPPLRADFILKVRLMDEELGRELESLVEYHSAEFREGASNECGSNESKPDDKTRSIDAPLVRFDDFFRSEKHAFATDEVILDRFRIVRFIDGGGMGEVYEAEDMLLGRIAIKTIRADLGGRPEILARFRQEVQMARKVANPGVCRIHELFPFPAEKKAGVAAILTMEFLEGITLAARIKRDGVLSFAEAGSIAVQLCAAVQAIHDAGVIHRDIKSRNIMLTPRNGATQVVVMDLGLAGKSAKESDSDTGLTRPDHVMGTPGHIDPQLRRGVQASPAGDIFALGVVLYHMMTGEIPPEVQVDRPAPRASLLRTDLPKVWDEVIARCLEYQREKRYQSGGEVAAALGGGTSDWRAPLFTLRQAAIVVFSLSALVAAAVVWRERMNASPRLPPEALALYQKGIADNAAGAWFAATKALGEAARLAPQAPQVHARLAEAWVGLEMPEKASEEMLLARRLNTSRLSRIDRLQIEAIDLSITREFAAASAKYEEMERAEPNSAEVEVDLGRAYENADRPDDAIRSYRLAAEGKEHNPAAWLRLAALYARQSNNVKSTEAFAQADRIYQLTSNLEGLTEVALQEGIAANSGGQLSAGATFLSKALDTARLAGNLQEEINATLRLSTNAYLAGDSAEAARYAREALDTARSHGLDSMAIRGLVNLGNAFRRKQDFAQSEEYYRDALDLARRTRSSHLAALSLSSLAALHDQTHQSADAVREAQEALTFYQINRYAKESLQCLTVIARAKRDSGDYDGALTSFRSILAMAERSQDRSQLALAHESVGTMLFREDRYPEALAEYRKSLEFAADAEHAGYASLECGNTLWRLGQYSEADIMFARADTSAQVFPPLKRLLSYGRAAMLLSQDRFEEAAGAARAALAADLSRTPGIRNQFERVLGLALVGIGRKDEGVRKCVEARTRIVSDQEIDDIPEAGVAVLESLVTAGENQSALRVFHEIEPSLAAYPELLWRAQTLISRATGQYKDAARESLLKLSQMWGESAYTTYLTRPDVVRLLQTFSGVVSAAK